jgi:hypothetical protein
VGAQLLEYFEEVKGDGLAALVSGALGAGASSTVLDSWVLCGVIVAVVALLLQMAIGMSD